MRLTHHAARRAIQRNIPQNILETLQAYGTERPTRDGALSLMLDDEAIDLAAECCSDRRHHLQRYRGAYMIVGEAGSVLTVARRTRRFRR